MSVLYWVGKYDETQMFNAYANLSGSLIVWRCIDKPKWGNYPINL